MSGWAEAGWVGLAGWAAETAGWGGAFRLQSPQGPQGHQSHQTVATCGSGAATSWWSRQHQAEHPGDTARAAWPGAGGRRWGSRQLRLRLRPPGPIQSWRPAGSLSRSHQTSKLLRGGRRPQMSLTLSMGGPQLPVPPLSPGTAALCLGVADAAAPRLKACPADAPELCPPQRCSPCTHLQPPGCMPEPPPPATGASSCQPCPSDRAGCSNTSKGVQAPCEL